VDEDNTIPNKNKIAKNNIKQINHDQMIEEDIEMQEHNNSL
jgi:hypothetical protein